MVALSRETDSYQGTPSRRAATAGTGTRFSGCAGYSG